MALFAAPPSSTSSFTNDMNGFQSGSGSGSTSASGSGTSASGSGQEIQTPTESKGLLNAVPAWGSYLYQNFLLPAFSPSEWLNSNHNNQAPVSFNDYFGDSQTHTNWGNPEVKAEPGLEYQQNQYHQDIQQQQQQQQQHQQSSLNRSHTAPSFPPNSFSQTINQQFPNHSMPSQPCHQSTYYPQQQYYEQPKQPSYSLGGTSMPTSILLAQTRSRGSNSTTQTISPSLDTIDAQIRTSPSPIDSTHQSPRHSPKRQKRFRRASSSSLDGEELELAAEVETEVPEGVERDGMIWGMKVEDYRALSARERKRVRNRISARTFRAKRKEHLTSLESTLGTKDLQIKLANEESARLRREVADLKRRLAAYES